MTERNPFERPTEPRSDWELLRWVVFDFRLVRAYEIGLSKRQQVSLILRVYLGWVVPIAVGIWLLSTGLIAGLDLPDLRPDWYGEEFLEAWEQLGTLGEKWFYLLAKSGLPLAEGLTLGLALGLVGGLALGLAFALGLGLVLGLAGGLGGLAFGLAEGLAVGLALGLTFGLALGLAFGPALSPALGLAVGLAFGLAVGLSFGLTFGLAVGLAYYISFFRLYLYPFRLLGGRELGRNPYLQDAGIYFPLFWIDRSLLRHAKETPEVGRKLADFLLAHRPLQTKLGYQLLHATTAGQWQAQSPAASVLRIPEIASKQGRFDYPQAWKTQIQQVRESLRQAESLDQTPRAQLFAWENFLEEWKEFETLVRQPTHRDWNQFYLEAVLAWREQTEETIERLRAEVQRRNPVADPIYKPGKALNPHLEEDRGLFLGREDLREQLIQRLYSTGYFPLFLVQGQRRVGKTSFLNFLPDLLGSGYQVITVDVQGRVRSIADWLSLLDQQLDRFAPEEPGKVPSPPSWESLEKRLLALSQQLDKRLVLACDEYEYLQDALQQDPKEAAFLLGAMRNFSQRQTKVIFLFAGSAFLSELRAPDWNHYFVQTELLKIDYLSETDANRLLQLVPLNYSEELLKRCYELTQGHPSLLQLIGKELVDLANREQRRELSLGDLETIAEGIPKDVQLPPAERFWNEVCGERYDPKAQEAVRLLLSGASPEILQPYNLSFIRLENHGFLLPVGNSWRFRVPLMESWVRRNVLGER